jgi:hypothetical protein
MVVVPSGHAARIETKRRFDSIELLVENGNLPQLGFPECHLDACESFTLLQKSQLLSLNLTLPI